MCLAHTDIGNVGLSWKLDGPEQVAHVAGRATYVRPIIPAAQLPISIVAPAINSAGYRHGAGAPVARGKRPGRFW